MNNSLTIQTVQTVTKAHGTSFDYSSATKKIQQVFNIWSVICVIPFETKMQNNQECSAINEKRIRIYL